MRAKIEHQKQKREKTMGEYSGWVAVVTGAASGLGAAMVERFADAGAGVALLDIDGDRVEAKAAALRARGIHALGLHADVGDSASLAAAVEAVRAQFGSCEILCANVGVQQFGAIDRLTPNDWAWVMNVNVLGMISTVAAFMPLLRVRAGAGQRHIVLTASASYFQPAVRMGAYIVSKYAVVGYGEVLRRELAEEGINVSLLFPAGMHTRHLESSMAARPAALGESQFDMADIPAMMASAGIKQDDPVATPEYALRNLLMELGRNAPYIITHGTYRHQVEAQQREVLAAFDRMSAH
jgi:NAD(P)-dependent dehydrogenase (short-subunit alcohol dehydrogenase family)